MHIIENINQLDDLLVEISDRYDLIFKIEPKIYNHYNGIYFDNKSYTNDMYNGYYIQTIIDIQIINNAFDAGLSNKDFKMVTSALHDLSNLLSNTNLKYIVDIDRVKGNIGNMDNKFIISIKVITDKYTGTISEYSQSLIQKDNEIFNILNEFFN